MFPAGNSNSHEFTMLPESEQQGPDCQMQSMAVMFTDTELDKLNSLAKKQKLPVATVAYRLIERSLKRA